MSSENSTALTTEEYISKAISILSSVIDNFIGSHQGIHQYLPGTIAWDWDPHIRTPTSPLPTSTSRLPSKLAEEEWEKCLARFKKHSYENSLIDFLREPYRHHSVSNGNLVIVRGGIGSGKTSTVNEIVNKLSNSMPSCQIFLFGCGDVESRLETGVSLDDHRRQVYDALSSELQRHSKLTSVNIVDEISGFWKWCFLHRDYITAHSGALSELICARWQQVEAITDSVRNSMAANALDKKYILQLYSELADKRSQDFEIAFWYRVFLLQWAFTGVIKDDDISKVVIFDNIDQLDPAVQREMVAVAGRLTTLLRARTIVFVRPVTYVNCLNMCRLTSKVLHCSPAWRNLYLAICSKAKEQGGDDRQLRVIFSHCAKVFERETILKTIADRTSGHSLRLFLRNLYNFVKTREFFEWLRNSLRGGESVLVSRLLRGYFFLPGSMSVSEDYFTVLYRTSLGSTGMHMTIKPRILDAVIRIGCSTIKDICEAILLPFGYPVEIIDAAFRDMIWMQRPLIWAYEDFDENQKITSSTASVHPTPIGIGYYQLMGDIAYEEVVHAEGREDYLSPEQLIYVSKNIASQEISEIAHFCKTKGGFELYRTLYCDKGLSLAHIYWERFKKASNARGKNYLNAVVSMDENRIEWLDRSIFEIFDHVDYWNQELG